MCSSQLLWSLCVSRKLEVTFQDSHLQRASSLSCWGEVRGLGTFDCEGFSLTTTLHAVNSSAKVHPSSLVRRALPAVHLTGLGKLRD